MAGRVKCFLKCGSPPCVQRHGGTILTELADEAHEFTDGTTVRVWNRAHPAALLFRSDRDTPNAIELTDEAASLAWGRGVNSFEYHDRRDDFRIRCGTCERVWVVGFEELAEWRGDDVVLGVHVGRPVGG